MARHRADQTGSPIRRLLAGPPGLGRARARGPVTVASAERLMPWVRATGAELGAPLGGWRAHLGASSVLDTAPFVGGYGMRGGVVLDDGTVVLPLCDIPEYRRVFVVRSDDGGATWSSGHRRWSSLPDRWFEEPAPLLLPSGRMLLLLRENASRTLWRTWSDDGGLYLGRSGADRNRRLSRATSPSCRRPRPVHLRLPSSTLRNPRGAVRTTKAPPGRPRRSRSGGPAEAGISAIHAPCEPRMASITVYYARQEDGCTCVCSTHWAAVAAARERCSGVRPAGDRSGGSVCTRVRRLQQHHPLQDFLPMPKFEMLPLKMGIVGELLLHALTSTRQLIEDHRESVRGTGITQLLVGS